MPNKNLDRSNQKLTNFNIDDVLNEAGNALLIVSKNDLIEFARTCANILHDKHLQTTDKAEAEKPISQSEAIDFFGKSRQTLISWRRKGLIKAYRISGRIYYKPSELLDALERLS